jgi:hypothetical protein
MLPSVIGSPGGCFYLAMSVAAPDFAKNVVLADNLVRLNALLPRRDRRLPF